MAKMTIKDVTYEGTPEELREIVRSFEESVVDAPATPKTEKRHAKVGERILIVDAGFSGGEYKNGDILTVESVGGDEVYIKERPDAPYIDHHEYEVIVEAEQANAKPAQEITHNGAKYTLVDRKAQPGDVVVIPKGGGSPFFNEGNAYKISDDGTSKNPTAIGNDGDFYLLYNYGRTEANTLVYAPVAEKLQVGDYVKPLPSADEEYVTTNSRMKLGKVRSVEGDSISVEIVSHEEGREVGHEFYVNALHFRKATAEEVAQATKPKTGDIVVITANTNSSRNAIGDIGKVGRTTSYDAIVDVPSKPSSPRVNGNWTLYNEMRLATPEEIAEYEKAVAEVEKAAVFTKFGRKPGEFKKGDIVRGFSDLDSRGYYGVIEDLSGKSIYTGVRIGDRYRALLDVVLIAPVESRVDLT